MKEEYLESTYNPSGFSRFWSENEAEKHDPDTWPLEFLLKQRRTVETQKILRNIPALPAPGLEQVMGTLNYRDVRHVALGWDPCRDDVRLFFPTP